MKAVARLLTYLLLDATNGMQSGGERGRGAAPVESYEKHKQVLRLSFATLRVAQMTIHLGSGVFRWRASCACPSTPHTVPGSLQYRLRGRPRGAWLLRRLSRGRELLTTLCLRNAGELC